MRVWSGDTCVQESDRRLLGACHARARGRRAAKSHDESAPVHSPIVSRAFGRENNIPQCGLLRCGIVNGAHVSVGHVRPSHRTRPTRPCPLRPDSDHDCTALQYVAKGQKRAHALQQLFDHLVGSLKERFRDRKAECLRGLEVDNQFELGRELDCPMNSSCFAAPNICLTTPVEPTIANRVCPALPSMVLRQSCCWTHSLPNFVSATFVDPRPHSTHDATAGCAGTMKLKIAPCGVLGLAHNRPLCASIIDRQIDSPSPKPSDFVV